MGPEVIGGFSCSRFVRGCAGSAAGWVERSGTTIGLSGSAAGWVTGSAFDSALVSSDDFGGSDFVSPMSKAGRSQAGLNSGTSVAKRKGVGPAAARYLSRLSAVTALQMIKALKNQRAK